MPYQNYTSEDFLELTAFRQWVYTPTAESDRHWSEVLDQQPELLSAVEEARTILLTIAAEDAPTQRDFTEVRARIKQRVEGAPGQRFPRVVALSGERPDAPHQPRRAWQKWAAVAAAVLLVLSLAYTFYPRTSMPLEPEWVIYENTQQDPFSLVLPDSSSILLNEGAELRYLAGWSEDRPREVWLTGEAFFEVTHQQNDRNFVVYAGPSEIEVLGTSFNVSQQLDRVEVVLEEGSVKLTPDREETSKEILLVPGELVRVETNRIEHLKVDVSEYAAWRRDKLVFRDETVFEIARRIGKHYDRSIEVDNPSLGERRFTLTGPADNLELMLNLIERGLDIRIEYREEVILLRPN